METTRRGGRSGATRRRRRRGLGAREGRGRRRRRQTFAQASPTPCGTTTRPKEQSYAVVGRFGMLLKSTCTSSSKRATFKCSGFACTPSMIDQTFHISVRLYQDDGKKVCHSHGRSRGARRRRSRVREPRTGRKRERDRDHWLAPFSQD